MSDLHNLSSFMVPDMPHWHLVEASKKSSDQKIDGYYFSHQEMVAGPTRPGPRNLSIKKYH